MNPIQNLLVIDSQVTDWRSLAAGAGADTAVLILDSATDGLTQISAYLSSLMTADAQTFTPLQSIQVISHGNAGSISLGSTSITTSTLKQYTSQLATIGSALTATGDILLYGCNVAATPLGLDFINQFAALTNADVAASTNLTGATALGGNWVLEATTGTIEAMVLQPVYNGLLLEIPGTDLADTLTGTSGNDTLYGYGGNDTIDGQAGSDTVYGGEGDDNIEGNFGNDTLYGENGNDTLTDDQGSNLLDGGAGDDTLKALTTSGFETLVGGLGNDTLSASGMSVVLSGNEDNDSLSAQNSQNATLSGGTGDDQLYANGVGTALLAGDQGNDYLTVSTSGTVTLTGGDGADSLYAVNVSGDALLQGDAGDDQLQIYQAQTATLLGGTGNDVLSASQVVNAALTGGDGQDSLTLYSAFNNGSYNYQSNVIANYNLDGGAGDDSLVATITANTGSAYFYFNPDPFAIPGMEEQWIDVMETGKIVNVTLTGDSGNDSLVLNGQNIVSAVLNGGDGNDTLTASGVLELTLTGGAGSDTFTLTAQQYRTLLTNQVVFYTQQGMFINSSAPTNVVDVKATVITDFSAGVGGDVLDYSDLLRNAALNYDGANPFSNGFLSLQQDGADTLLLFDADGSAGTGSSTVVIARLQNVTASTLILIVP